MIAYPFCNFGKKLRVLGRRRNEENEQAVDGSDVCTRESPRSRERERESKEMRMAIKRQINGVEDWIALEIYGIMKATYE